LKSDVIPYSLDWKFSEPPLQLPKDDLSFYYALALGASVIILMIMLMLTLVTWKMIKLRRKKTKKPAAWLDEVITIIIK